MSSLEIQLENGSSTFRPGEEISGKVTWVLDNPAFALELSLFWRTEGKGTQDIGIAETVRFENPGTFGTQEFSIAAPAGPYSFSGKLISILWALELACEKGKESVRRDVVISPMGSEILCTESISDSSGGDRPGGLLGGLVNRLGESAGAQVESFTQDGQAHNESVR